MEIEVKGHSGCNIEIVRDGNELFINKSCVDKKYLKRLLLQAEKQRKACQYEYQHIRVPNICSIKENADRVDVKMEYVYSKNFIEYFESAGFEQISYFEKALILFIEREVAISPVVSLPFSIIWNKFEDVNEKIKANSIIKDNKDVEEIIKKCKVIFPNEGEISIPVGICHGDLTFSNILFNGNNYYLIDFLDSFIESPLLDIVKIRQDSRYLWSQLMYIHDYDKIRLEIVSAKIDKEIDSFFSRYNWYKKYYKIFQLMNFMRILQYAHEDKVVHYLINVIKSIQDEF